MSSRSRPQTATPSKISRPTSQSNGRSSHLTIQQTQRPNSASKIPTLRRPESDGRRTPDHLPHRLGHLPAFLRRQRKQEEARSEKLTSIREEVWIEELMALPSIEHETSPPLVGPGELDVSCGSWDRQKTFTL